MRKLVYVAVIIVTASLGAFLIADYEEDDLGRRWVRSHLAVIRDQLSGLKKHLELYKASHGRYPTNDEGLAVLGNYDARFVAKFPMNSGEAVAQGSGFYGGWTRMFWWQRSRRTIGEYRREHGRVPRNSREFASAHVGSDWDALGDNEELVALRMEIGIGKEDSVFLLSPSGVLSPWLIPYVYENRSGVDPKKFQGSPADVDSSRRYSVRVDDGIYLYSIGGQFYADKLDRMEREANSPRWLGCVLILVAVVCVVVMARRSRRGKLAGVVALLLSAGAGAVLGGTRATCYVMSPLFSSRDPEMGARRRALLDRYHQSGVIGDETYAKAVSALKKGAATRPASGPSKPE